MTTKGEWVAYTGSDEQIAEIKNTQNGYVLKKNNGQEVVFLSIEYRPNLENTTHYWIIPSDPLRDMKIRQATTGQPVWIRIKNDLRGNYINLRYVTTTPDWNIPGAEYRFTPFEE